MENKDNNIRPKKLSSYIGQSEIIKQIEIYISSAKKREDSLDHILFSGGPGLGKTTLAQSIAEDFETNIILANAANMQKPKDIVSYLVSIEEGDFLFIDEIHRLKKELEEVLYTAMEDFRIDILVDRGSETVPLSIDIPKFTLIGATTMKGKMSTPLTERFGIDLLLREYNIEELTLIIERTSKLLNIDISKEAAKELSQRSRGTPRRANRLLKRIVDFAMHESITIIEKEFIQNILDSELKVDENGLEERDIKFLKALYFDFKDIPVGVKNISSAIGENIDTLEQSIEPYLISKNFIIRTQRGRKITDKGKSLILNE